MQAQASRAEQAARQAYEALRALPLKATHAERLKDTEALKALDDAAKATKVWLNEAKAQGGDALDEARKLTWMVFDEVGAMLGDDEFEVVK